jgi:hypothetical protein
MANLIPLKFAIFRILICVFLHCCLTVGSQQVVLPAFLMTGNNAPSLTKAALSVINPFVNVGTANMTYIFTFLLNKDHTLL